MSLDKIFKTSAITGVMSIITMTASLVRGKVMALCLGPAGVGMSGILNQVSALEAQILGIGLPTVAVKSVAGASAEDRPKVESVIGRLALFLGLLGLMLGLALSPLLTVVTFGTTEHWALMIAAALAVPAAIMTSIWSAVIQGRGEVGFIAKSQAGFAVASAIIAVPLIWFGGLAGLGASMVVASLVPVAGLWNRRPRLQDPAPEDKATRDPIIRAGLAILAAIAIAQVAAYASRLAVVSQLGVFDAGLYQAAFAVSGGLPGFVFSAMALDYYPSISAAKSDEEVAHATNLQVLACTVIATPVFVGMIIFGGQLLDFYYTKEFLGASGLMVWMTVSVAFRVISWPAGYWLLAKATPREYLLIEGPSAVLGPLVTFCLLPSVGLAGAGMAMVLSALVYALVILTFMYRRGGISYAGSTWGWAILCAVQVGIACLFFHQGASLLYGGLFLAASIAISSVAYPLIRRAKA